MPADRRVRLPEPLMRILAGRRCSACSPALPRNLALAALARAAALPVQSRTAALTGRQSARSRCPHRHGRQPPKRSPAEPRTATLASRRSARPRCPHRHAGQLPERWLALPVPPRSLSPGALARAAVLPTSSRSTAAEAHDSVACAAALAPPCSPRQQPSPVAEVLPRAVAFARSRAAAYPLRASKRRTRVERRESTGGRKGIR